MFDPLIVELMAVNGEHRLSESLWKLQREAYEPEVLFLRSGGLMTTFVKMSPRANRPCKPHFVSMSGGKQK